MKKRLFIAIKINPSDEFFNAVSDIKNSFSNEKIVWTSGKAIHITLRFLGDTDMEKIPIIIEKLREASLNISSFEFNIQRLGVFPNINRPRVIWLGLSDSIKLLSLHNNINDLVKELDFKHDKHKFRPHITLGRIKFLKNRKNLNKQIKDYSNQTFQNIVVNEFYLYESILPPLEKEYKIIEEFKLKE